MGYNLFIPLSTVEGSGQGDIKSFQPVDNCNIFWWLLSPAHTLGDNSVKHKNNLNRINGSSFKTIRILHSTSIGGRNFYEVWGLATDNQLFIHA